MRGAVVFVATLMVLPVAAGCKSHTARPVAAATTATTPSPTATTPAPRSSPRPTPTRSAAPVVPTPTPTPSPTRTRPAPPPPTCLKSQIDLSFRMNAVDFARTDTVTFTTVVRNHSATACGIAFRPPCYDSIAVVTAHSHWVWSSGNCELPPLPEPRPLPAHGRLTFVEQWNQRPSCGPFPCGSPAPARVAPGRYFAHATCLVSYDHNDFIFISSQQIGFTIHS